MTVYRVGEAGATVFDTEGAVVARLSPGQIVVEGTIEARGTQAAQHAENENVRKRVRDYPDKALHAGRYQDKAR